MKNALPEVFNGLSYLLVILQQNETFQLIELIVSIVVSVTLLSYRIWKWWKEAKKDGKITSDEIDAIAEDVKNTAEEIKDKVDHKKGE